jgi:hypothetical protein
MALNRFNDWFGPRSYVDFMSCASRQAGACGRHAYGSKFILDYVHHFLNIGFLLVFGAINCLLEESHESEVGEDASRS